jgi:hypothetical protein
MLMFDRAYLLEIDRMGVKKPALGGLRYGLRHVGKSASYAATIHAGALGYSLLHYFHEIDGIYGAVIFAHRTEKAG